MPTLEGMHERFHKFAQTIAERVGSVQALVIACAVVLAWAISGPLFHFSDTWQLVINTSTTIVTFLMVFVIQATQNRDAKAVHLKLDELIRAHKHARTFFEDLEDATEDELKELSHQFKRAHERASEAPGGHDGPRKGAPR
ncbi:low affinity iron permease family protein [Myxococcus stipitatus]|uniref:low affinity iron permease family protein n=1 Tax=Myxococcus stipitatus TaxID=83455 RepID=UPI001F444CE9|nr:low affinity iron permease family protein [Myxococcus stipitatus]MCE9671711.1 low affinity iron permease family protein [Myxococcus stipitatus]